jgi:hypothetical protein
VSKFRGRPMSLIRSLARNCGIAVILTISLLSISLLSVIGSSTPASATPACGGTGGYAYAGAESGYGSAGTAVQTYVWTQYDLSDFHTNFTDQASWLSAASGSQSLETGFFSGADLAAGGGQYTDKIVPYYTLDDGTDEVDFWTDTLTEGDFITLYSYFGTNGLLNSAVGGDHLLSNYSYSISDPLNSSQAEVYNFNDLIDDAYHQTMAGSTDHFWGYYLPNGDPPSDFTGWTYSSICLDDPSVYENLSLSDNEWYVDGGWPIS